MFKKNEEKTVFEKNKTCYGKEKNEELNLKEAESKKLNTLQFGAKIS